MNELDAGKADAWRYAMQRVKVAGELRSELLKLCPDSQVDAVGARSNAAARAALNAACDIIRHSRPVKNSHPVMDGHWSGLIEGAVKIISAVELEMYDPRVHPERYK